MRKKQPPAGGITKFNPLVAIAFVVVVFVLTASSAHATAPVEFSLTQMLMGLMGGIALLLYGLDVMSASLKTIAGDKLKTILAKLTRTRLKALFTGIAVTAVVQSSAATTVMVVGFIASRLMKLSQALGVVLGADIGTTITVQLIAFRLNQYALFAVAAGVFLQLIQRESRLHYVGRAVMGVGLIFFGIQLIGNGMGGIRELPVVEDIMTHLSSPLAGIVVGAVITALMQSSAAALAVVIAVASHGVLPAEAAISLILGANLGTCLTALLASIGKSRRALRVATAHLLFKSSGVAATLALMPLFLNLLDTISPFNQTNGLSPFEARDVANAHTLFNVLLAIFFLPFTEQIARLLKRLIPLDAIDQMARPKFLDKDLLGTPVMALNAVRNELGRIGQMSIEMARSLMPAVISGSNAELNKIARQEAVVDDLYKACVKYMAAISKKNLGERQSQELLFLMATLNNLENIGDLVGDEMVKLGRKRINRGVRVSEKTARILGKLHTSVLKALEQSVLALQENSLKASNKVLGMKRSIIRPVAIQAFDRQAKRLTAKEKNRFNTFSVETDMVDKLQRIYYHCRRIAHNNAELLNQQSAEKPSRRNRRQGELPLE